MWKEDRRRELQLHGGQGKSSKKLPDLHRTRSDETAVTAAGVASVKSASTHVRTLSAHDLASSDEPFLRATRPPAPEKLFPGEGAKYQGYASKRGQTNTTFKKRYFVLEGYGMLKYYKDQSAFETGAVCAGSIRCKGMIVAVSERQTDLSHAQFGYEFTVAGAPCETCLPHLLLA